MAHAAQSIRHEKYESSTELSKKCWEIKGRGGDLEIRLEIMRQTNSKEGRLSRYDLRVR